MISRYLVIGEIGMGGMGVVLAAYDPELDRKLAIKLLHQGARDPENARLRLLREAQALARLHHPNVVAVHDVGVHEGAVFVAMELVQGTSLRAWIEAERSADGTPRPRSWREIVPVFREAARGLAAAHHAGLVHRDFKPDNTMIDASGRVCVLDFGLARADGESLETARPADAPRESSPLNERLTQHGALIGTPAYLSPEQVRGDVATPRSDQFSFCVSLFEALWGRRPFRGDSIPALLVAIDRGEIRVPTSPRVPAWLRRLVLRGLASNQAERHADMDAILRELADARRTRTRIAAAAGIAVALGGTTLLLTRVPPDPCAQAQTRLDGAWDPERKRGAIGRLRDLAVPYAPAIAERVEAELDAYAQRWQAMNEDACRATHVRHEQSEDLLDRRVACLDDRRRVLVALVDLLETADTSLAEHAVESAQRLPSIAPCGDLDALLQAAPPPTEPAGRAIYDRARERVARATAARTAALYDRGLEHIAAALSDATEIGHDALLADVGVVQAKLLEGAGRRSEAADALRQAHYRARRGGNERASVEAEIEAVYVIGYRLARFDEGKWWAQSARGALERIDDPLLDARLENHLGVVLYAAGQTDAGLEHLQRALAGRQAHLAPDDLDVAEAHHNLAIALEGVGRLPEAQAHAESALALRITVVGPDHPLVASSRFALALLAQAAGSVDEARAGWREVERIQRAVYGTKHPKVALTLNNLGTAALGAGDLVTAEAELSEALAIYEATVGSEDAEYQRVLQNLGTVLASRGELAKALDLLTRALHGREARLGRDHRDVAVTLTQLGRVRWELGDAAAGRADLERAIVILQSSTDTMTLARARISLARVLGRAEPRARELATLARDGFASAGVGGADGVREVEAWLAAAD